MGGIEGRAAEVEPGHATAASKYTNAPASIRRAKPSGRRARARRVYAYSLGVSCGWQGYTPCVIAFQCLAQSASDDKGVPIATGGSDFATYGMAG